jgi:hypothetical protein
MGEETKVRGAGGTPGGMGQFLIGFVMIVAGGYLLTSQVVVSGGSWSLGGHGSFGLALLPLLAGIGILFWNGRSIIGWLLLVAGLVILFAGILMNLHIYFQPTSLFNTLAMLVLLAGGIGLAVRSLSPR